jgi:hypothetical protein
MINWFETIEPFLIVFYQGIVTIDNTS